MNLPLYDIIRVTDAEYRTGDPLRPVGRICTDTRTIREGETFLALNGKNFQGEEFIAQAIAKGALGIITSFAEPLADLPGDCFHLRVKDTTRALGDIAREWRRLVNPTVVAITGSSGKTTTKEMLAFICRGTVSLLATEGNLNNLIGLPQMLLRLRNDHEVAILETGMNQSGELKRLSEICIPDIAVITNIGNAHIGNFGTIENLIKAKAELFEAMPRAGTAIINADCPHASMMAEAFDIPEMVISYGQNPKADVRADSVELVSPYGYVFNLKVLEESHRIHLKVYGRYQVMNALAAAAAAATLGIAPDVIAARLTEFNAPSMRAQTEWCDGFLLIADCYNASPDATITSLRSLNDLSGINQRYAVLGDMLELGEHSERYHRAVGLAVAEVGVDLLCTVGNDARFILEEAENHGIAARHFTDADEIADFLNRRLKSNDALIVKGSRGMRLENVVRKLKEMRCAVRNGDHASEAVGKEQEP